MSDLALRLKRPEGAPICRVLPAFEVFSKRFAYIGLGAVVVALAGKLARPGQVKPGFVVLGHRLAEQRALWVTRKVNRRALYVYVI